MLMLSLIFFTVQKSRAPGSVCIHQHSGHAGIQNLVHRCLLFTQVIPKSLENVAMFMWVKRWGTRTRMTRDKIVSTNITTDMDGVIKACPNTLMLKHHPSCHHERSDLAWLSSCPSIWSPHLYTTLLPLLSSTQPLIWQDLSLSCPYVSYTHSHKRPMDALRGGDTLPDTGIYPGEEAGYTEE